MPLIRLKDGEMPCWIPGGGPSFAPGVDVDVTKELADALLLSGRFEHVHDDSCHHDAEPAVSVIPNPADEATENHEEGL